MTLPLYAATVPGFLQILPAMTTLVDKAETWCRENGLPDAELLEARLAEDMWPFVRQIRATWTYSIGAIEGALEGETSPDMSPPPADFAALRTGIDDAMARLKAVTPAAVDALAGKDVYMAIGERRMDFLAEDFLMAFAVPNFYFHATTAYAILRSRGLDVGKRDFLGGLRLKIR